MSEILTCVYCGQEYPPGTPPHGAQILTDHIKVCIKHPMRALEVKYALIRNALLGLVGTEDRIHLDAMEAHTRMTKSICEEDRAGTLNAIHAIRETIVEPVAGLPMASGGLSA